MNTTATRLLEIGFEGYFMCRIATDPDPTNEERGMSGYTMALASESRLDQVIRLQVDDAFWHTNARPPLPEMGVRVGVRVRSVRFDGQPWAPGRALLGAAVHLEGRDAPLDGPVFESRNNITGSDDTMSFVIDPFRLRIVGEGVEIRAEDHADPNNPSAAVWQIGDPAIYARRLTRCWSVNDMEVAKAIGVFDPYGYFRDRRRYLTRRITEIEEQLHRSDLDPARRHVLEAEVAGYQSRIYQLELWGDRVISKIQTRCDWQFDVNGPQSVTGDLGGRVDTGTPWPLSLWFGGWDGDLLLGYTRGTLALPMAPNS